MGRAGGRAYGRIQRAAEGVKIAEWARERDALRAEIESETAAERLRVQEGSARREKARIPIEKSAVRVLGWFVLWEAKS